MGAVYKAEHRLMERHVALKVINPSLINKPAMVERFHREVKAAARLAHPNIVTAYDADQAGQTHFLVMEFAEGISLAQRVHRQGRLPVALACEYIRQAALGLQHASERGMVHRDIKPHNLMLTPDGQIKILDFGLARFVREQATAGGEADPLQTEANRPAGQAKSGPLTEIGEVMGTADFIAPEQAADPRQADIRADIYSLGCTLYYLLAGHVPFPEGTALDKLTAHRERLPAALTKLRDDVPAKLAGVIEKMTAKDPAQRYQTPAEVAKTLHPFVTAKAPPHRRARRLVLAACLAGVALLLGTLIYIQTDKGVFVIETEDEQIAMMVEKTGVKIHDRAANREYLLKVGTHNIRSGEYEIDVTELPDGVEFRTKTFTLKRGGVVRATAWVKSKMDKDYLKDEALAWFPADATFYGGRDLRVFPDLSVQQLLVLTQLAEKINPSDRDRFWMLVSIIGRIDRVAFAYVEEWQQPAKSRIFVRVTGSIKHQRLADWFRQNWPGVIINEQKGAQNEPISLISSTQPVAPALALIGDTDLILGGYQGIAEKHLEVIQQALNLRAGHGESLPGAFAKALESIPADAWMFMMGEPPDVFKKHVLFRVLPKTVVLGVVGTKQIQFNLHAMMPTAADAKAFVANLDELRQKGIQFVKKPPVKISPKASQLLETALKGVEIGTFKDHASAGVTIPSETLDALAETLRDLPLSLFVKMAGLADKPAAKPQTSTVKTFRLAPKPIAQDGVTADKGGWRIEAKESRTVPLFRVPNPGIEDCLVTYRARIASANLQGRAYLEMKCHLPGNGEFFSRGLFNAVSGTTDWGKYDTPFFLDKGQRPDLIRLNLVVEGKGTVWIKDVELFSEPLPPLALYRKSRGQSIKAFHPQDKPLTQDRLVPEGDGWRIEAGEKEVRTVHLFEVPNPADGPCLLVYRLKMRTSLLGGHAYQEMWCRFPGNGEYFSKGFDRMATGDSDWTTYVIPFRLGKGPQPELVKLDLVIAGMGKVWIKDVELLRAPLGP